MFQTTSWCFVTPETGRLCTISVVDTDWSARNVYRGCISIWILCHCFDSVPASIEHYRRLWDGLIKEHNFALAGSSDLPSEAWDEVMVLYRLRSAALCYWLPCACVLSASLAQERLRKNILGTYSWDKFRIGVLLPTQPIVSHLCLTLDLCFIKAIPFAVMPVISSLSGPQPQKPHSYYFS